MKIDKNFVKSVAKISKIALTEEELEKLTPQMQTILDYAGKLALVDTTHIHQKPLRTVPFSDLRDDVIGESLSKEEVFANVKDDMRVGDLFKAIGGTY